jgi:hypothetical protein
MAQDRTTGKNKPRKPAERGRSRALGAANGRLREAAHFWRQALVSYDEREAFRVNVNACIQALRNITWQLQSEKEQIPAFDEWYGRWQAQLSGDRTLKWLVQARNRIVKQSDLKTESKARVFLVMGYHEPPVQEFLVSPRHSAEAIARRLRASDDIPLVIRRDGMLAVERRWVDSNLAERELLDALAHCYRKLSLLLEEAHQLLGLKMVDSKADGMFVSRRDRLVVLDISSGTRIRIEGEVMRYSEKFMQDQAADVEKHYGTTLKPAPLRPIVDAGDYWLERAKVVMSVDGAHRTFVFFYNGATPGTKSPVLVSEPIWDNYKAKYLMWRHIADQAVELESTAVMVIGEQWRVSAKEWVAGIEIDDQRGRRELLTVCVLTRTGTARSWSAPIIRTASGIEFGTTQVEDSVILGLQPLVIEWSNRPRPAV